MYDAFRSYFKQDNRKFFIANENKSKVEMFGLKFRPSFNSNSQLSCFSATYHGIWVKLKRLRIEFSGSVHTSSKGHNGGKFQFTDLKVLFRFLKAKFGNTFMKSTVSNLEYGLLVESDNVDWIRYKNVYTDKMKDKPTGKVYGQKITLYDFEIKRYDKYLQMILKDKKFKELPIEGFRLEVKVNRMRSIQKAKMPVNIYIVEDLLSQSNLIDMHNYLQSILNIITMKSDLIIDKLRNDKKMFNIYGHMNCELTNRILKEDNNSTHKYYQKELRSFLNEGMKTYNTELNAKLDQHLNLVLS